MKNAWFVILLLVIQRTHAQESRWRYSSTDSATAPASTRYGLRSPLQRIFLGRNYRHTWNTPVTLPVFRLSGSGLSIVKLGGGQQTKSLRLQDPTGKEWVLRTIDKDVTGAMPPFLRRTPAQAIVQDLISASYPFSHTIVATLAKAANIAAPDPSIYFVADDTALAAYRPHFANSICMLEERTPLPDSFTADDTKALLQKLVKENEDRVAQQKVLKTRLLDMLVGDWDRHEDQWLWAAPSKGQGRVYFAIPRDRDNALFHSGGLLPKLAQLVFMPHLGGFKKKSSGLKKLNLKSWNFDQAFLNELDAEDWKAAISSLQQAWNDSILEASLRTLPKEIYNEDAGKLLAKLKSRRDGLLEHGMVYYRRLSAAVAVNGTQEKEVFELTPEGKKLRVTVYRLGSAGSRHRIYERYFDPEETKSVQLAGLGGEDQFLVNGEIPSGMKISYGL